MAGIDRFTIVAENFSKYISAGQLPQAGVDVKPLDVGLSDALLKELFTSQITCRHIDLQARYLQQQGSGFYTIASAGHEGNAVLGEVFAYTDPAFLHYRSGALMLQRAKQVAGVDNIREQLLSMVAAKTDPIAQGRHKVFGSVPLHVPPQTSTIASHLPKAVGCAFGITLARQLKQEGLLQQFQTHQTLVDLDSNPVVLCSFGDASVNHSTAQGAFHLASWIVKHHSALPIVFVCEDNGIGVSVKTPADWIEQSMAGRCGIEYIAADGLHLADSYQAANEAKAIAIEQGKPVFLYLKMTRLMGHAGSDIESEYLTEQEIEQHEFNDPLLHSARLLLENNIMSTDDILALYNEIDKHVAAIANDVAQEQQLSSADEVMASIIPDYDAATDYGIEVSKQTRANIFDNAPLDRPRNMCQQINYALRDLMAEHPEVVLLGEDVAIKGGVYHVSADLYKLFGAKRVLDTLLDEQSILGTAMGLAHNGFIPIPEIQFLAYLHNAEDQLRGEAATLSFFSSGQFTNPMVIRIPSFAYQKGFGGHFHNDNAIGVLTDIPGIIIACPSNGEDAAKMLRHCVRLAKQQQRIVVFLEPIALYMQKDLITAGDNKWLANYSDPSEEIQCGEIAITGEGNDTAIISYANGYYLACQAAAKTDKPITLIDLRWLAPLNSEAIINAVKNHKHIIIVDECRQSGSISEAIITLLQQNLTSLPKITRITAKDSFIPLGPAAQCVLPSVDDILAAIKTHPT